MKNVKVNDKTYTAVSTVQLALADGTGNAQFKDVDEIVEPSGTKSITTNGTHDVKDYASVEVNVAGGGESTQDQWVQFCNGEITSVDLTGATKIPINMFREHTALVGVTMPDVTDIGGFAFYGCTKLNISELPDSIKNIANNAFQNSSVTLERLPNSLIMVGNGAFQNCNGITISELPNTLSTFGNNSFSDCTSISELTFHGNVVLGNNTFSGCTNLKKVIFKGTVGGSYATAFANCPNLTDIYVPWDESVASKAPWGATNATIHYNSAV